MLRGSTPSQAAAVLRSGGLVILAIALVDRNKNGRFDSIHFVASPYIAGPYAEGEYEISLPVTSQLISGIKPEYRSSFERQRQ